MTQTRGQSRPDFLARFQSALPLLILYFGLAALYAWQASRHLVPTIFTDELELTQLARSISETGEPARRGDPYGFATLVAYVLAPVWWLDSAEDSYATAKLVLVLAMTATLFPAYGLARLVVTRWFALAAAGAASAVPALAYSSILVEEPLAYPLATLALLLIARTLLAPSWGHLAAAAAVCATAAWTRTQLSILFAVLALGLLWLAWESEQARRWRTSWTRWDWTGAIIIALGAALAFSALMGHLSTSWRETTGFYKERIFEHASWAMGGLAIGIGILPLIVGVAALARPKGELRDRRTHAFVVTSVASLAVFIWYAGIKGAYLSTQFATLVYERNVIYLSPLLFAAMALALTRGVGRAWSIAVGAVGAIYVANAVPIVLDYPYYEAHGLAILAFGNRELGWSEGTIDGALVFASLAALAIVVALRLVRRGSAAYAAIAGVAALAVVAWTMTTQVYAAEGERILAKQVAGNLPKPYDWVERATGGDSVVVLGQQILDPTNVQLTEFFNPSIRKMWSLDGSALSVGAPILTPDLDATDGTLTPSPETDYALGVNGVALVAPIVDERKDAVLYRLDGKPIRLRDVVIGRAQDGWITAESGSKTARASYTRYDVAGDGDGFAVVRLSRVGWCPDPGRRDAGIATVRIGPVGIGPDKQPAIARVTAKRRFRVPDCEANGELLPTPRGPWRVEIAVARTFSPRELDPSKSDNRQLGAVLEVKFQPLIGS